MLYSTLLLATAAATLASAQNSTGFTIDPNSVPIDEREAWCRAQRGNCPLICGTEGADMNNCYADTLTYQCTCNSGAHPNISAYQATLPSYICQEYVTQCVTAAGNDLGKLTDCHDIKCGMRNASAASVASSPSASASASGSPSQSGGGATGTSGGGAAATSSGAAVALGVARSYGTGILAGGMLAFFGLAL